MNDMGTAISHGVFRLRDLAAQLPSKEINAAIRSQRLSRIAYGWYAVPGAIPQVVRAVQRGETVTCLSALKLHGIWVPPSNRDHRRAMHGHPRRPDHCSGWHPPRTCDPIDPPLVALRQTRTCLGTEGFVVLCDSLLNHGLAPAVLRGELADLPASVRARLDLCDLSESGTETIVRLRLRRLGIAVRCQVVIKGIGRVDLLIGASLIIEVDSVSHHTSLKDYEKDRLRDRAAITLGYTVIRLTYEQVMGNWDACAEQILAIVRADRHRRVPTTMDDAPFPPR